MFTGECLECVTHYNCTQYSAGRCDSMGTGPAKCIPCQSDSDCAHFDIHKYCEIGDCKTERVTQGAHPLIISLDLNSIFKVNITTIITGYNVKWYVLSAGVLFN